MNDVYFITGVTGFLGEEILSLLIAGEASRVYCLIRGKDDLSAGERLRRICAETGIGDSERLQAIDGDLGMERLGMDESVYNGLTREVTHIIHSAADVRFNRSLESIRKTNVGGTANIIAFARDCLDNNENFSHLSYVGTCFVAGKKKGIAGENELTDKYGFKNTYEQSKFEAEKLLRENMKDLPVMIFRPSIIVGLSESGKAKPRNVIYPMLKLFLTWKIPAVPLNLRTRLDIVPVDFVARAIVHITSMPDNMGKCFALAAGPGNNVRLITMLRMVTREFGKDTAVIPSSVWRLLIRPVLRRMKPELYAKVSRVFSAFEPYVWQMSPQYAVDNTRKALEGSGIALPDTGRFIRNCFRYANETDFGEKPPMEENPRSDNAVHAGSMG